MIQSFQVLSAVTCQLPHVLLKAQTVDVFFYISFSQWFPYNITKVYLFIYLIFHEQFSPSLRTKL